MVLPLVKKRITDLILKAQNANEEELVLLREKILNMVSRMGAKFFVNSTAEVLKNSFKIEGCNDARIPLKRIFNISLDELDKRLSEHSYSLPAGHPIALLSEDHKESMARIKELRFSLGKLNLNKESSREVIKDRLNQVKDYYEELDSHIKKEEEVLFPALEKAGMNEHPQNLRDEHKKFRDTLSSIIQMFDASFKNSPGLEIEKIGKVKEEFISAISNHIFRETYIFYPSALEFITEAKTWQEIAKRFDQFAYKAGS